MLFATSVSAAEQSATLLFAGDIMMHDTNIKAGKIAAQAAGNKTGYDFRKFFDKIRQTFKDADLVVGNLETKLAGKAAGFTGYPRFNAPDELARDLKWAGFNLLTTANNHALDRGPSGAIRTIQLLDGIGLANTGTYASKPANEKIFITKKNGIRIAVLNYTYGTNGYRPPAGREYLLKYLDRNRMKSDLAKARLQADFVVFFLHFGYEYETKPRAADRKLVDELFAGGADLVIGSHPHVVQPVETKTIIFEGKPKKVSVAYSLGNFVSAQTLPGTDKGLLYKVRIAKQAGARAELKETQSIRIKTLRPRQLGYYGYEVVLDK